MQTTEERIHALEAQLRAAKEIITGLVAMDEQGAYHNLYQSRVRLDDIFPNLPEFDLEADEREAAIRGERP